MNNLDTNKTGIISENHRNKKLRLESIAVLIFVSAFLCAAYGFLRQENTWVPDAELIFSSIFKMLQMPILNYGWTEEDHVAVKMAMFLFPASISFALGSLLKGKAGRIFKTIQINLFCRNHIIVVGECKLAASIAIRHAKKRTRNQQIIFLGKVENNIEIENMRKSGVYFMPEEHIDASAIIELNARNAKYIYLISNELSSEFMEFLLQEISTPPLIRPRNKKKHQLTIFMQSIDDFQSQKITSSIKNKFQKNTNHSENNPVEIRPINLWKLFTHQIFLHEKLSPTVLMRDHDSDRFNIYLLGSNEDLKREFIIQSSLLLGVGGDTCKGHAKVKVFCVVNGESSLVESIRSSSPIFTKFDNTSTCNDKIEVNQHNKCSYWSEMEKQFLPAIDFSEITTNEFYTTHTIDTACKILYIFPNSADETFSIVSKLEKFLPPSIRCESKRKDKLIEITDKITEIIPFDASNNSRSSNSDSSTGSSEANDKAVIFHELHILNSSAKLAEHFHEGHITERGGQWIHKAYEKCGSNPESVLNHVVDSFFTESFEMTFSDWAKKEEWEKESSRQSFIHSGILRERFPELKNMKCLKDFTDERTLHKNKLAEILELEHNRWAIERLYLGWRHTTEKKNTLHRMHPQIKPFSSISEDEKHKDLTCVATGILLFNKLHEERYESAVMNSSKGFN